MHRPILKGQRNDDIYIYIYISPSWDFEGVGGGLCPVHILPGNASDAVARALGPFYPGWSQKECQNDRGGK